MMQKVSRQMTMPDSTQLTSTLKFLHFIQLIARCWLPIAFYSITLLQQKILHQKKCTENDVYIPKLEHNI